MYAAPQVLGIRDGPPACAPCDRAAVPGFDRWVIRPPLDDLSTAGTVTLVALGAATAWSQGFDREGLRRTAAAVEAAAWAVGTTELIKTLAARNRPVLYTTDAPTAADNLDSRRSFPSGHAAAAFAIAVSYWLDANEHTLPARVAALATAAGVAALRVAAGRHFPSDVAAGAALGTVSAVVIHEIRF